MSGSVVLDVDWVVEVPLNLAPGSGEDITGENLTAIGGVVHGLGLVVYGVEDVKVRRSPGYEVFPEVRSFGYRVHFSIPSN